MRIVRLLVFAIFLFTATAYAYQDASNTLRTPVMSNGTEDGAKRLENAVEKVTENTPGLWEKLKIWRLSRTGWGKIVCAKFTDEKDKVAALKLIGPFVEILSKNKSDIPETVSAIVEAAQNIDELKIIINIKHAYIDNEVESNSAIIAAAQIRGSTEKRQEAFKALISLVNALRINRLYVAWTLREAVPALFESSKRDAGALADSLNFGIALAREIGEEKERVKRDVGTTLFGIAKMMVIADPDSYADMRETIAAINKELFLFTSDLGKLARFNTAIVDSIHHLEDLKQVKDDIIPQIIRGAGDPRALKFVTEAHIRSAIETQKQNGGFVIVFDYKAPDEKKGNGRRESINGEAAKETCSIKISPFSAWAAQQGNDGQAKALSSNTNLPVSFEELDHAVIMARAGIASPESFIRSIDILLENKIEKIIIVAVSDGEMDELKAKIGAQAFEDIQRKGVKFKVPDASALNALSAEIAIYEKNMFFAPGQDVSIFKLTNEDVIKGI